MIDKSLYNQFSSGKMNDIKGITIHNTNNELNAQENYDLILSLKFISCHYIVDNLGIIQFLPLNLGAFHTGKAYDVGNMHTISIEICSKGSIEEYMQTQNSAVKLIKDLMKQFNLTKNDIYFHNDFDRNKYCPHRILNMYKNKNDFIEKELI